MAGEAISVQGRARVAGRAIAAGSPYLLIAPALLFMAAVSVYPLFYGVRASLAEYKYGRELGFQGLDNYRRVLADDVFWQAMYVTLRFVLIAVTLETILRGALAVLLSRDPPFARLIPPGLVLPLTGAPFR